ncbi:MAG TPA: ABC transporter ATP-binding protein [Anaerolineales bacterium]|nr:ABC transporter ATP-binding protein [Anaerolineales bacterium]HNA56027.1 ABC transporter ATP-binding protein [Anaerolineales bacterium]HNC07891.1 ABC transporter ATP-binding protein [Anaerolineales bacterium]HND93331.1 ABC transporter ATP-binding protein [Anaerolineales bacterium]HNE04877.1 ABC transporter ATP-binding protein [Anaerolineales bacterium]
MTKVYGMGEATVHALAGVDMTVEKGEFVAIMGHSGSGKSTLMNILGCLDRPTAGAYIFDGRDVSRLSKNELAEVRNQKLGFIFQSFNLLPRLSALSNVMLPMLYNMEEDISDEDAEKRAAASLQAVGLGERLHHQPNQLSGGQQQRVAIARALVNNPPLILADEPTGNLDSRSSVEIMEILHHLHKHGATIVMVTHEPDIAEHAGRVVCVKDGKILSDGHEGNNPCLNKRMA